jgi:hypothetical protein
MSISIELSTFLPYLIVIASHSMQACFQQRSAPGPDQWVRHGQRAVLWASLALSIYVALISRPLHALATREARQQAWLDSVAMQTIGQQSARVLMEPWEFYATGRKLGWKMYKPFYEQFDATRIAEMDYIIMGPSSDLRAELPPGQFEQVGTPWLEHNPEADANSDTRASVYGPYLIFKNNDGRLP